MDNYLYDEEQHRRLTEPHRSKGAKLGWKKYRSNYMRGFRKRERMDTFADIRERLKETLKQIQEAKLEKDSMFDLKGEIVFENLSGGLSFSINKDNGTVSISTTLNQNSKGNYKPQTDDTDYENLYEDLKDELSMLAKTIDDSMKQILAKHGLREV